MQPTERVFEGGTVESTEQHRRNLIARGAQRARKKIPRSHLSTGTPDVIRFASARTEIMQFSKDEGKSSAERQKEGRAVVKGICICILRGLVFGLLRLTIVDRKFRSLHGPIVEECSCHQEIIRVEAGSHSDARWKRTLTRRLRA
jgi:hypothetical protein